jgi:uncharacterized membrane protein
MATKQSRMLKPFRIVRSHIRLSLATVILCVVFLVLPRNWDAMARFLIAWDTAVIFFLISVCAIIAQFDLKRVRARAAETDEGAIAILALTVIAAMVSVFAIVQLLGVAKTTGSEMRGVFLGLAMITIVLSWCFIHFIFALRYAHEFYGEGRDSHLGGLKFPSDNRPEYWDFIYFSFVLGMTFQVSDVQVTSKYLRRVVIAHGIISFFFSVCILALAVNIGSTLI